MLKYVLSLLIALPLSPPGYAALARNQAAGDWSGAARTLLDDYRAGRYGFVQQESQRLLSAESDERVRRDLRALMAMTLLRSESREDRTSGRAMLAALEQEDRSFGSRPECLLAMGVGLVGLSETGGALDNIDAAVDGFLAQGDQPRAVDALAALAGAWAAHMEWELTPRRLGIALPATTEQAAAIRVSRIRDIRQRAAGLVNAERGLRHIDLTLAAALIESAGDVAGAVEILERLANVETIDPPAAAALDRLGSIYGGRRRWDEAVAVYERLAAADLGDLSYRARRAAAEIVEPSVTIEAPAAVQPGESLAVEVAARNVEGVSLEIRRFDLTGWLASHQGRLIEGRLSDTGALAAPAVRLAPNVERPHDLWQSRDSGEPLTFDLPKGGYAAIARAKSRDGREHVAQKLVMVSGLRAATFIGEGQAVVWVVAGDAPPATAEAFFWMNGGTFVAPAREVVDGVARFALPAEAKLARDKRWACVVQSGDDLALCRGSLAPASVEPAKRDSVLVLMNGLSFDAGETLELRGMIMPAAASRRRPPPAGSDRTVQVDILDAAQGRTVATLVRPVSDFGTFEASLALGTDLAGRSLHVVIRKDGEVLPGVEGQSRFNVREASDAGLRPRLLIPATVDVETGQLTGEVVAHYPGGVPAAGAGVELGVYGLSVPAPGRPGLPAPMEAKFFYAQFDDDGRVRFSFPFDALRLEGSWGVADLYARISGWDDGTEAVRSVVDIGPGGPAGASHHQGGSDGTVPAALASGGDTFSEPRVSASLVPGGVRVEVSHPSSTPTLVLLEDGAPLAAHAWGAGQGGAVTLKADAMRAASAQVLLVQMDANGPTLADATDVAFADEGGLSISAAPPAVAAPGGSLGVRVATDGAGGRDGFVMLRLVDATPKGLDEIWRGYGKPSEKPASGLQMASSGGEEVAGYQPRGVGVSRRFREAALMGGSVAVDGAALTGGAAEFRMPIPSASGDYQLIALLRRADGGYATARLPVDFAGVARAALHVPEALRLGDRAQATVTLEAGGAQGAPVSADVRIDVGGGLSQIAPLTESTEGEVIERYATDVEASNVGPGVASADVADVDVEGGGWAFRAHYVVYPDQGDMDGLATGWFDDTATLSAPADGWTSGSPTTLVIQSSLADVVVDSATEWLNEPIEGTAWRIARFLWAESLLSLRPEWSDRPVGEILHEVEPAPLGRERLRRLADMTLAEFRDAAIDGLLTAQRRDGGWGRWQSDVPEAPATAWAADALETVLHRSEADSGPHAASRPRIETALRQGQGWLGGALSAAPSTTGGPGDSVAALFGLSRSAAGDAALLARWSALADRVRRSAAEGLNAQDTAMLSVALRRVGRTREADALLTEFQKSPADKPSGRPGTDLAWMAIGRIEADLSGTAAAERLLAVRSGLAWGDPLLTAWSLRAISAAADAGGEPVATGAVVVEADGKQVAQQTLTGDGSARRVTLPAASSVELKHAGTGSLTAAWIGASEGPAAAPVATVRRQLTLLRLDRQESHKALVDMGPYSGQPLEPGQHLRVRETWQLNRALTHAEWFQPLPGGFFPWRSGSPAASIGGIERRDRHGLCWAAPSLAAGEHVRDYVIIAGSPGTFLFPSPELRVEGRRVPVELASERLRLTVSPAR